MREKRLNWLRSCPLNRLAVAPIPRCFEFHVSSQELIQVHRIVRSPQMIGQARFTRADNVPAQRLSSSRHETFKRCTQLVFRLTMSDLRRFGCDSVGEILEGRIKRS